MTCKCINGIIYYPVPYPVMVRFRDGVVAMVYSPTDIRSGGGTLHKNYLKLPFEIIK